MGSLEQALREANPRLGPADVLHQLRIEWEKYAGLLVWPCDAAICRAAPFTALPPCLKDMNPEGLAAMVLASLPLDDDEKRR